MLTFCELWGGGISLPRAFGCCLRVSISLSIHVGLPGVRPGKRPSNCGKVPFSFLPFLPFLASSLYCFSAPWGFEDSHNSLDFRRSAPRARPCPRDGSSRPVPVPDCALASTSREFASDARKGSRTKGWQSGFSGGLGALVLLLVRGVGAVRHHEGQAEPERMFIFFGGGFVGEKTLEVSEIPVFSKQYSQNVFVRNSKL